MEGDGDGDDDVVVDKEDSFDTVIDGDMMNVVVVEVVDDVVVGDDDGVVVAAVVDVGVGVADVAFLYDGELRMLVIV